MIGWVQAVSLAAVIISVVVVLGLLAEQWLNQRHKERMERMKHRQEIESKELDSLNDDA